MVVTAVVVTVANIVPADVVVLGGVPLVVVADVLVLVVFAVVVLFVLFVVVLAVVEPDLLQLTADVSSSIITSIPAKM